MILKLFANYDLWLVSIFILAIIGTKLFFMFHCGANCNNTLKISYGMLGNDKCPVNAVSAKISTKKGMTFIHLNDLSYHNITLSRLTILAPPECELLFALQDSP